MCQTKEGIPNLILDKPICWTMINMDEVNKVPFSERDLSAYKREQKGERGLKRLNKLRAFGLCTSALA